MDHAVLIVGHVATDEARSGAMQSIRQVEKLYGTFDKWKRAPKFSCQVEKICAAFNNWKRFITRKLERGKRTPPSRDEAAEANRWRRRAASGHSKNEQDRGRKQEKGENGGSPLGVWQSGSTALQGESGSPKLRARWLLIWFYIQFYFYMFLNPLVFQNLYFDR